MTSPVKPPLCTPTSLLNTAQDVGLGDTVGPPQLKPAAAETFYREECRNHDMHPNNTFVKQLLAGVTVFDFENGYLGERGIVPILSTLQRLPVVELSMRNCEINTDDVALIQKTFASHGTLRKIDLRGIPLKVAAARRLLTLAVQNSRVTEILLDEDTPKYLHIQRQCFTNAGLQILASRCLVCNRPVIHSPDQRVEGHLLLSLGDELNRMAPATTEVALQAMLRCILACCEVGDGVLFICSSECRIQLTKDIFTAMRAVVCECFSGEKAAYPKNPMFRQCVENMLKINLGQLTTTLSKHSVRGEERMLRGSIQSGNRYDYDFSDDDDDEIRREKLSDAELEECTICGTHAVCLPNGGLRAMHHVCNDIREGSMLRPSALLRLIKLLIQYTDMRPCTENCVTHLVRFGMYGYGGVLQTCNKISEPTISSLDIPLTYLPSDDFAILNFSAAYVDEIDEEDTCCALTVASAMSDMDGVAIDPYMIFACGRHLAKLPPRALGMELRHACEAVQLVGCLPAGVGPFDRRKKKPPRNSYVLWERWHEHADLNDIVRVAFSRRRQGVYVVEGPHGNLFDNARSALWAFRNQRCSVLVAMKFSLEWMVFPGGVVPNESTLQQCFLTTFKIVGQTSIDNALYLICQGNFGPRVGNKGFFYIPRGVFNLCVTGAAYIFVDAAAYMISRGHRQNLYAARVLPKQATQLVEQLPLLRGLYDFCKEALNWRTRHRLECTKVVCEALCHLPPPIFFIYRGCDREVTETQTALLKMLRQIVFMSSARSLLFFYIHEVLGLKSIEWVSALAQQISQYPPLSVLLQENVEILSSSDLQRRQARIEWSPLRTEKKPIVRVVSRPPEPHPAKKTVTKRMSKTATEKKSAKEARDTFLDKLENRWTKVREDRESIKELRRSSRREGHSFFSSSFASGLTAGFTARSMAEECDIIPPSLVGYPWHSIRLTNADGKLTDYAMFFIKDHICCINVKNHTLTEPLHPTLGSHFARSFPFTTGFDCALNSPVNPRTVYFFCGERWIEWDAYWQTCTGGPFKLQTHRQFAELPPEFMYRIDAAVPIPNTSCAFLFSQLMYIVFDFEKRQPVGGVRRIGDDKTSEENLATFGTTLAKLFPYGPMTTLLWSTEETPPACDEQAEESSTESASKTREDSALVEKVRVMLIGRDGRLATVCSFASAEPTLALEAFQTIPASCFSRIPLALQQMTTAALHGVCKCVLEAECNRCGVVLDTSHHVRDQVKTITSTLTQKGDELENLFSLTRRDIKCTASSLLCEEVIFVQTEESMLDGPPQVIDVDYGSTNPVDFGVLVVVLDTARLDPRVLRIAPIMAVVESSVDGIVYIAHTRFVLLPYVTATCWGDAPAARFWRIRFLTRLPVNTGVVRLLWYKVFCALGTIPLDPCIPHAPHESTNVNITAPHILCKPTQLLLSLTPGVVFASSTSHGWLNKHCILPLLPDGKFCLFFCGKNFLEFDIEHNIVISHRSIPLAGHPGFANLPYPFSNGFDAVFYPNPQNPNVVALLHGKDIILWNLQFGAVEKNDSKNSPNAFFKGLPWSLDQIEDIVQIWDCPGEFFLLQTSQVLRWSIITLEVVEGPMVLRNCPYFYHAEFDDKPLLCAVSFPKDPKRFHVFCEDRVAVHTVIDDTVTNTVGPVSVRQCDLFSTITWYLNWGRRRYDSVICIDFKEGPPLLTGVAMHSSEPCEEDWLIEYSDDGVEWNTVGHHLQSSALSRTRWGLASVACVSHRLWRLTTEARQGRDVERPPVLYMAMDLFTLPCSPYLQSARKIAFSGTLNKPISTLFVEAKTTVTFESATESRGECKPGIHHMTLGYEKLNSPNLMAFACRSVGAPVTVIWSVWCSDDGDHWEKCGKWRSRFRHFKALWKPRGPRQYWRIELQTWEPNVLFEDLCLLEYLGPSLALENSTLFGDGWDASLLWEKNCVGCKVSPMIFSANVGTAVVFDSKQAPLHVVGVRLVSHGTQNTSTNFVIECSSNTMEWRTINVSLLLRNGSAQAAWDNGGYYRFWRLRIVQHTGPPLLMLRDICFEISKSALYRVVESNNVDGGYNGCELSLGTKLKEVVALQTVLPPNSRYVVEKLSLDGAIWEEVASIQNVDTARSHTVRQRWMPRGCSSNWRLRPALEEGEGDVTTLSYSLPTNMCVQWYSFGGTTLVSAQIGDVPSVEVVTTGFVEVQAAKRLTENETDSVVLRSREEEEEEMVTVTWVFSNGTTPRFCQVFLGGRTVFKSVTSNSASPSPQLKPTTVSSILLPMKMSKRFGANGIRNGGTDAADAGDAIVAAGEEVEEGGATVVVETSENGVDYVPIAKRLFSQVGNSLSWAMNVSATYWRIRFKGIRETEVLELWQVTWYIETGVNAVWAQSKPCMLSSSMYTTWQEAAFNNEDEFCRICREGFDQARSVASGLRKAGDIDRHGIVAKSVVQLRGEFTKFVAKVSKDAVKDKNPPQDKFICIGQPLSNDIMYLLYKAAKKYDCNVDELNQLVSHPLLLARDMVRSNENMSWFYPMFLQEGTLVESFYGFHRLRASLGVLWSLSLQVQRNLDLLLKSFLNPLSPHLASVIITVHIERSDWIAAEHFPQLPLLYDAGFTGRHMVMVFTLNQVVFNSRYNLTIPGADPFPAIFPFKILPGVNFIQRIPIAVCPSPLFDCLQMIYSEEFLSKYETELVFTSPSMQSNTGLVRFTLPGEGINLGIPGLTIGSFEFEVQLVAESHLDDERAALITIGQRETEKDRSQMVTFVTHDTVFKGANVDPPIQLSLVGCFEPMEEQISICGTSPSAHLPLTCRFSDAFLTNLKVSFDLMTGEASQSFVEPYFTLAGTLTIPTCGSYDCCLLQVRLDRRYETLVLQVVDLHLSKLIQLGGYMVNTLPQIKKNEWLHAVPIVCSLSLSMRCSEVKAFGTGTIEFVGFRGDAYATILPGCIGITATLPSLRIGSILLEGKSDKECIVLHIAMPASGASVIRLDGYSALLAPHLSPIKVEMSQAGVMCVSTGVFYDLCIEEESLFPSGAYAQVTISHSVLTKCLSELLQETPMIAAVLAKGIPFSLEVGEVVGAECLLEQKLLFLTVRGVLFGCRFDVTISVVSPDNSLEEARRICQLLLPCIVEQCDESLWAAYEMLAGYLSPLELNKETNVASEAKDEGGKVDEEDSKSEVEEASLVSGVRPAPARYSLTAANGQFIKHWMKCECEALDRAIQADFEMGLYKDSEVCLDESPKGV
ncbi:hypothetical protein TraAM80_02002 [Trypanosoma rangeli]|uniref:Uncharacterized protein n=1 Tax=Trypanosoma rangeli TaxID=5698 RepID=A0A422NWD7_TRYRA|nr:uncharacterized protein TraAM80_02002 [Trypanosoma rangeli]RNF09734.1 hypothetical protein TraAM80_02002 [Trypanosoma rangeli]|eukprot:RNF09734.1 hypothetical protein TraAM80_02002 [Trypanosoma rangeli]